MSGSDIGRLEVSERAGGTGIALVRGMEKHKYGSFEDCAKCQSYVRLGESFGNAQGYKATTRKLHKASNARKEREQALKGMGLTKVRGALGGIYWE